MPVIGPEAGQVGSLWAGAAAQTRRESNKGKPSLSIAMSAASCSLMHFAMVASLSPTVEMQQPSVQNLLLPNLYFRLACLSKITSELLPFR